MPGANFPSSPSPRSVLVGREREHGVLRTQLEAALAGHGSLALVSGAAGIGKSTLVRAITDDADSFHCLALSGSCYDSGTPVAYGLWRELLRSATRHDDLLSTLSALKDRDWLAGASSPDAFFSDLQQILEALAERSPLLLVLEDLHWADAESLQFLRVFARRIPDMPVLLIATYRDDDLGPTTALYQLLPHLVRESNAQRVALHPLDTSAVETLVEQRYGLSKHDLSRLTEHLKTRSQGVPLYVLELLRTLEEERRLDLTPDGWVLGDVDLTQVPVLVKQLIEARIARFNPDARRLIELAAVIGTNVPVLLWRKIGEARDELFAQTIELSTQAHLLEESSSDLYLQFSHALVRDALYEGMSLPRRQRWHRRIAEVLANEPGSEPDSVAHHFRQALDPRAIQWFIRAGSRAERVAWTTAANHFAAAAEMMTGSDADPAEQGWLLMRRAKLLRSAESRMALSVLEAAEARAIEADDTVLLAYVTFFRGQIRCLVGEIQTGITDMESGVTTLAHLSSDDIERVEALEREGMVVNLHEAQGLLAALLAAVGRIDTGLSLADDIIEHVDGTPARAWWARSVATALAGRPSEAAHAFKKWHDTFTNAEESLSAAPLLLYQLAYAQLPYGADDLVERRRIADAGEAAWRRSGESHGDVSPRIASLPILFIEGEWREARELAVAGRRSSDTTSEKHLVSTTVLAQLARAQGDPSLARLLIRELLPVGAETVPGNVDLTPALMLMRVAARLCLDDEDLSAARAWLDAHDRWLTWSGAVLGKADGQLLHAQYFRTTGDLAAARRHASRAIELAGEPHQPLALLSAQRTLGEIETSNGRLNEARAHIEAALDLADACAAPYERALTLLAAAELNLRAGEIEAAAAALNEARSIFSTLEAAPALTRAGAIETRLSDLRAAASKTTAFGLSPRELEVLQLIAAGRSNREIAETFFLSVRTIERHITNLYAKIGANSRAEAMAYAHEHRLI